MKADFSPHNGEDDWRLYLVNKNLFDYFFSSVTTLARGIWMSFFDTEEAHAVMPAYGTDRGGRAALKVIPISLDLEGLGGGRRPPGSSGKSMLKAPS